MTTPVRKKLIEVSIPLEAINVASAREKSIRHGHPSTLHLWWARRPLAACRAVLFAQLVDDPSSWPDRFPSEEAQDAERRRLHKVIEAMVPWEASNNETILTAARWEIARSVAWGLGEEPPAADDGPAILDYLQTKGPPVYDPFSGGGSIPLEAQRLGLRAYGSDLNPVAVLIGKALVKIPPKFAGRPPINPRSRTEAANGQLRAWKGAQGLAEDVRYYGQWMRDEAEKRIGHLYPKAALPDGSKATVIAWLWARTVRSPDPAAKGAMVPLISSFMISTKNGKKAWVEPVRDSEAAYGWRFEVQTSASAPEHEDQLKMGTKASRGASFRCILTNAPIDPSYVRTEAKAGRMGAVPFATVADGGRGRVFLTIDATQALAAVSARPDDRPDELLHRNSRYMTPTIFGLEKAGDLFLDRQIVALNEFSSQLREVRKQITLDLASSGAGGALDYAQSLSIYLALCISRQANRSSSLCFWDSEGHNIQQVFARQALSMTWDFVESNPFSRSSGNFVGQVEYLSKVVQDGGAAGLSGQIVQSAAQTAPIPDGSVISTDPPYYDNVPYADISDFFYVWLRRSLREIEPSLFARILTPKEQELVAFPERHGGQDFADAFFIKGMSDVFLNAHSKSSNDYPTIIYYAFRQSESADDLVTSPGWVTFLQAVLNAGFSVDGTWPVRTELVGNLKKKKNVLATSVVLVCRKRLPSAAIITREDFIRALKREMPAAIEAIKRASVGPVDMQQSVIGPGMGVFSRQAKVLEDDDSAMGVKAALALINRVWEEIDNELDQAFDPETQVALAWYATFGFDTRASGELLTLTTAKNTSDRALFTSGVFKDMKGKAGLTPREELPSDWSPASDKTLTTWECVQHTARVLNASDGGGEAAAMLVAQMGPKAEEARALAYRLFEIATTKGWAAEALVYNELAQEWTKLEDRAATLDDAGRAPGSNQTTFAFDRSA